MADGPVTLVTGGSRGIGLGLAHALTAAGHTVVTCSRNQPSGTVPFDHREVDVTDERAVIAMMHGIRRTHGRLDVLVNNAGRARMNLAGLTSQAEVERTFALNTIAPFVVSREAAKLMRRSPHGRIVTMTSVAAPLALAGEAAYAASKAAAETMTRVLARELAGLGITVNAIGPTIVDTDLTRNLPTHSVEALLAQQAIPRKATIADVANAVRFFVDPASDMVTGQVIYLGGVW